MGLVAGLIGKGLRTAAMVMEAVRELELPQLPRSPVFDGEDVPDRWAGPDDTWPVEDEIAQTPSEPELIVTEQFGLRLPNGRIVWNGWNNPPLFIPFNNPLDRLRMVANIQKSAQDLGFDERDLLSHYGWVSRNQIATVVYEDTGAYSLTDAKICGAAPSHQGNSDGSTHSPTSSTDPEGACDSNGAVREGSLGGDA